MAESMLDQQIRIHEISLNEYWINESMNKRMEEWMKARKKLVWKVEQYPSLYPNWNT